jgi:hypothetical protein
MKLARRPHRKVVRRHNPSGDAGRAVGYLATGGVIGAGAGAILNALNSPCAGQNPALLCGAGWGAVQGASWGLGIVSLGALVVAAANERKRELGLVTAGLGLGGLIVLGVASSMVARTA